MHFQNYFPLTMSWRSLHQISRNYQNLSHKQEHLEDLRKRYEISEEHAKAILELAREHRKSE